MYPFIFVDDEPMMREFFQEVLDFHSYGFTLQAVFSSAEQAEAYLQEHGEIRAVITDIRMGNLSGIDLCERVRAENENILLVILSGFQEFEYARRAIQCRVFDYLLKPTLFEDFDMLFRRMKKQLDESGPEEKKRIRPGGDYHYESLVDRIRQYIQENYSQDITLEVVAGAVGMNASYLSRFFKQHTGSNFLDYLSEVRVEKAIGYLTDATVRIGEICDLVGYRTPQHFYKIFKQYTGYTPSEYRTRVLQKKGEEEG